MSEGLVDLSLFSYSPTDDRCFSITEPFSLPDASNQSNDGFRGDSNFTREFYAPRATDRALNERMQSKPLPRLPPRAICGPLSIPRECDLTSTCILNRMKRKRNDDSPGSTDNTLSRRRNVASPPQLLLSGPPPSRATHGPTSELVWMPEEQMWLVVGEGERIPAPNASDINATRGQQASSVNRTRSEPTTRVQSEWHDTPPMSPIQSQLRSLIERRDDERLSPLFQEAMNSVPMDDTMDPPPPPTYERTVRGRQASTESFNSIPSSNGLLPSASLSLNAAAVSQLPPSRPPMTRAASFGNHYTSRSPHPTNENPTSETNSMCRSQTQPQYRSRLQPATSRYGIYPMDRLQQNWTPPESWRVKHDSSTNSSNERSGNFGVLDNELKSTKSWSGWARKFARPRSAT